MEFHRYAVTHGATFQNEELNGFSVLRTYSTIAEAKAEAEAKNYICIVCRDKDEPWKRFLDFDEEEKRWRYFSLFSIRAMARL